MNTQDLILNALVKKLEEQGGTAVIDPEWGNTGMVSFVPEGSLTPHSKVRYQFNQTYWTIKDLQGKTVGSFFDFDMGKKYAEDELAKVVDYLVA